MKNFIKRTITGAVFISLIIGSILLGENVFCSLFLIFSLLATKEYCSIANNLPNVRLNWTIACVETFILYISFLLLFIYSNFSGILFALGILGLLICIVGLVFFELLTFKDNHSLHNMAYYIFGQFVIVIPFVFLSYLNTIKVEFYSFDISATILFFVCIWLNDTGAYLFGSTFGKHKMAPNISPKKSWEGFVGGVFLVTLIATLLWIFNILGGGYVFYAIITSLAATAGDLLESLFKRRANVKDSGKLLPGHGGILDRFDSVLLASPVLLFTVILSKFISFII